MKSVLTALEQADPVFHGNGLPAALLLLLVLWFAVPKSERGLVSQPALLLILSAVFVTLSAIVPPEFGGTLFRLLGMFCLLASLGRAAFLLFVSAIWVRKIARPLPKILRDVFQALIYIAIGLLVLRSAGVEPGSLLTTSALLTAVIGLSLQDTLGNLFAGLAIQAQRPFDVGDWIRFDEKEGHLGRVLEINWRATRVLTLEQLEIVVPNGAVARAPILNYSRPTDVVRREVAVVAPYHISPDRVRHWLLDAVGHTPLVLADPQPRVVTNDYNDRGVEYLVRYFIRDFNQHEIIESDVRDRLWYALSRNGVTIPVPGARIELRRAPTASEPLVESIDSRTQLLRGLDLFRGLSPDEVKLMATKSRRQTFAPEELIVREGEESNEMFIIEQGRVRVEASTSMGSEVVSLLKRGDFFGEMSLLTGAKRVANVIADTETEVIVLDPATVSPLLEKNPELAQLISRVLNERQERLTQIRGEPSSELMRKRTEDELLDRIRRFFHL